MFDDCCRELLRISFALFLPALWHRTFLPAGSGRTPRSHFITSNSMQARPRRSCSPWSSGRRNSSICWTNWILNLDKRVLDAWKVSLSGSVSWLPHETLPFHVRLNRNPHTAALTDSSPGTCSFESLSRVHFGVYPISSTEGGFGEAIEEISGSVLPEVQVTVISEKLNY